MILDPAPNDYFNANETSEKVSAWSLHLHGLAIEHSYLKLCVQTRGLKVEIEALLLLVNV